MRRLFPVTEETEAPTPSGMAETGGADAPEENRAGAGGGREVPRAADAAGASGGSGVAGGPGGAGGADAAEEGTSAAAGGPGASGERRASGGGVSGASGSEPRVTSAGGEGVGVRGGGRSDAVDREWGLDELAAAYAYPESPEGGGAVWLRANMVSTLDGAAQHDGRSQPLSTEADMRIFGTLRGLADVVLVGAETARQEGYRPAREREAFAEARRAAGQGPAPAVAVVSASLELDFSLPLFTSPLVPTLVLTGAAAAPDRVAAAEKAGARVVIAGDGMGVDPARAVRALADLGLTRLLSEGGPRLLGQLIAADVLDELCLTMAPMLTAGDAQRIAGGPSVPVPKRFELVSLLEEDGFLFGRYRRT